MTETSQQSYTTVDGLSVALADGVLSVTLDRPDALNAVNARLLGRLADAFTVAATDPRVRVVRLGGAGRGFCSGADIAGKSNRSPDPSDSANDVLPTTVDEANRLVTAITSLPRPVVAAVQGPAAGFGVSLALACDIVIASEKAFFMLAFTKIGLMPDGGATALIAASIGRIRAMRMSLLAERISAADALQWGLVSAVHPAESFDAEVDKVVATLAAGPPLALSRSKEAINSAALTELAQALQLEQQGQELLLQSADFAEGARAFQQKRTPEFTGH